MGFLVAPLYIMAVIFGLLSLVGILITAIQRGENNINTDIWIGAYQRTKPLTIALLASFALLFAASYVDNSTKPSFKSAYTSCLTASDSEAHSYQGTINRQSSCVLIARAVVNQTKEE